VPSQLGPGGSDDERPVDDGAIFLCSVPRFTFPRLFFLLGRVLFRVPNVESFRKGTNSCSVLELVAEYKMPNVAHRLGFISEIKSTDTWVRS